MAILLIFTLAAFFKFSAHSQNRADGSIKKKHSSNRSKFRYILQFNAYLHLDERNSYIQMVLGLSAFSPGCKHARKNISSHFESGTTAQFSFRCVWLGARQRNVVTTTNLASDFSVIKLIRGTHYTNQTTVLTLLSKQFKAARKESIWVRNVVSDLRVKNFNTARRILQSRWVTSTRATGKKTVGYMYNRSADGSRHYNRRRAKPQL